MTDPVLLYGVGATKSGTSWLYRTLYEREDCELSAVKETHYWDTFNLTDRAAQQEVFQRQRNRLARQLVAAQEINREWKIRNLTRRLDDLDRLTAMLEDGREAHTAYAAYLMARADEGTKLVADICPSYALLPDIRYREMAAMGDTTRFVYLIRDPLARLWSAVRMQAERQAQPGEDFEEKANNTLWRILKRGAEEHITERGDYASTVMRLRSALPRKAIHVAYMETLMTDAGYGDLCDFLGLPRAPAPTHEVVNSGSQAHMRPKLRRRALEFLTPQYEFAEKYIGPLPAAWAQSRSVGA
ncbi:MAG: sulfotransferase [Pseudomonadota bacterium]